MKRSIPDGYQNSRYSKSRNQQLRYYKSNKNSQKRIEFNGLQTERPGYAQFKHNLRVNISDFITQKSNNKKKVNLVKVGKGILSKKFLSGSQGKTKLVRYNNLNGNFKEDEYKKPIDDILKEEVKKPKVNNWVGDEIKIQR